LKKQLERSSSFSSQADASASDSLKIELDQALAEVSALKTKLQSIQSLHQEVEAKLEGMKKAKDEIELNAASAAGPDAVKALAEKQALLDERDRAVTKLASQTQAWNVEREQLKKEFEQTKSVLESKLAEASKITPGVVSDSEFASKLEKLDSILKSSIKTGDLRGAAVAEVGRVCIPICCNCIISFDSLLSDVFFCNLMFCIQLLGKAHALEYENLALKHPPPKSSSCSLM
jgi:hypothetical protein